MRLSLRRVAGDQVMPQSTGVVVIGGGIVGVSAALFLARSRVRVVLCEKGEIGAEQSGRNWGWCRQMGRDPAELPLMAESLRLWKNRASLSGADTGFRTTGIIYAFYTQAQEAEHEAWLDKARIHQTGARLVGADELEKLLPGVARRFRGALYTADDGGAEPSLAAPAIAEAARQHGAVLMTNCAVRGLEVTNGGVTAAITEKGIIRCDGALLTGGAWSRLFCGPLGLDLPQLKVTGSVMRTAPLAGGPEISAAGPRFGYRKMRDGGYIVSQASATISDIVPDSFRLFWDFLPAWKAEWKRLRLRLGPRFLEEWRTPRQWPLDGRSPFEVTRILDPEPSQSVLDEAWRVIARTLPVFQDMRVVAQWGGVIDVTPDALPVISPAPSIANFHLATGFSAHGFGIGPGAGRLAAELVMGASPCVDPSPFRASRFARMRVPGVPVNEPLVRSSTQIDTGAKLPDVDRQGAPADNS
jgi:glycine/D-amino acid oxidase-like deaminating enzyme